MSEQLTKLESSVYHYLLDFTAENTYQPSIRDIGKQFKIKSTKTVSDLLQSLAKKGYIERDPARSRGVNLLGFGAAMRTQPVPFYGRIHAGEPALLPEHRQGFITIDRRFVPSDEVFFLKVKGDSMVGRCINDGDYVMVNPKQDPSEHDIVAARLGEDATVKTYTRRGGSVVLRRRIRQTGISRCRREWILESSASSAGSFARASTRTRVVTRRSRSATKMTT